MDLWIVCAVLGVCVVALAAALVRQIQGRRDLRRKLSRAQSDVAYSQSESAGARAQADALREELVHLAETRLPALIDRDVRQYRSIEVPGLLHEELAPTAVGAGHETVLGLVGEAAATARHNVARSTLAAVRDMLDEPQTMLAAAQKRLLDEVERHPDASAYVEGLMSLDHLITRCLHGVQRMRIVAGSWPGVQRANLPFAELIEGARGRIDAYRRVAYSYEPDTGKVWIEGRVAEPLAVALTELLNNATSYSHGQVQVFIQQVHDGYCVVVDDAGVGMDVFLREQAATALSRGGVIDVTSLPDSVQLGFTVIGRLCHEYGFDVDVSSVSPFGGVRAVLRVPHTLLADGPNDTRETRPRATGAPDAAPVPEPAQDLVPDPAPQPEPAQAAPAATAAQALPGAPEEEEPLPTGPAGEIRTTASASGLPRRRRRSPAPAAAPEPDTAPAVLQDPEAAAAGLANVASAIRTAEGEDQHHD
ncbi:histidine kinase [Streptomyces sp. RFCAC02]|uniref:histidine kinase n=1 Tax=Streptomyces sp. RFCAC02 TaxID=2499143 RepID=UPI001F1024D2|nr:histidine kinase [Streptomyces sp. RFCAC02]